MTDPQAAALVASDPTPGSASVARCHPRRKTSPSLDGLCATCACFFRAEVRRGQSPDEARAAVRNRVERENAERAANGAALRADYELAVKNGSAQESY